MAAQNTDFQKFIKSIDVGSGTNQFFKRIKYTFIAMSHLLKGDARYYVSHYERIKIEPKTILFESFWGRKIGCNPYAVYRALMQTPEGASFKVFWVKDEGVEAPKDVKANRNVSFVVHGSNAFAAALLRAKYLVCNSTFQPYFIRKPGQIYINTWHGLPLKHMGFDADPKLVASANVQRNFIQATHITIGGSYAEEKIVKPYGATAATKPKVLHVGSPRVDLTLAANPVEVRSRLGLSDTRPVILYAPTWRGRINAVDADVEQQFEAVRLLQREFGGSHHILVSLHNFVVARLKELPPTIKLVSDTVDINETLAAVDVLVSDYSSIIFDYLVLDRPIVLYVPDRAVYEAERGLYIKLEDLPVVLSAGLKDLPSAVRAAKRPSAFSTYERAKAQFLENEDGAASHRAVELITGNSRLRTIDWAAKKRLLMYAGGMKLNGITTSFLSLVANIDYKKYDVFVVVDAADIDRDAAKRTMLDKLDPRANTILRVGPANMQARTAEEPLKGSALKSLNRFFELEAKRVFGQMSFDVAIDYSGYSPWWAYLMSKVDAKRRAIYQHNDLHAEAYNEDTKRDQRQLRGVFQTYKIYDVVVAVSPVLHTVNVEKLSKYYKDTLQSCSIKNLVIPSEIRRLSSIKVSTVLPTSPGHPHYKGKYKFVCVGRLSPEKNHKRLIHAFEKLVLEGRSACLFIVGDGPLMQTIRLEAELRGLEDHVVFMGNKYNPYSIMAACDCVILTSDYEGQPIVLLEALVLAKKVIATNTPGSRSVLEGGKGLLVEKSVEGVFKGMTDMMDGKVKIKPFDPDAHIRDAMNLFYRNICGEAT
jgi:CDP-glycerol glycerophosphotransferase